MMAAADTKTYNKAPSPPTQSYSQRCQQAFAQCDKERSCIWELGRTAHTPSEAAAQLFRASGPPPAGFVLPPELAPCYNAIASAFTAWEIAENAMQRLSEQLVAALPSPLLPVQPSEQQRTAIIDLFLVVHDHICSAISSATEVSKLSGKWYSYEEISGNLLFWSKGSDKGSQHDVAQQEDQGKDMTTSSQPSQTDQHNPAWAAEGIQSSLPNQPPSLQGAQAKVDRTSSTPRYLRGCLQCQTIFSRVHGNMVNGHSLSRHILRMSLPLTKAQFNNNYSDPEWATENYGTLAIHQLDGSVADLHDGSGFIFCKQCDSSAAEHAFQRTMQQLLVSLEDPKSSMPSKKPRPVTTGQNIYELAARFSYLALLTDALSSDEAFLMRLRLAATLRNPQGHTDLPEIYCMRPALYLKPDTDPSQRLHREMFTPWMQSIADFSCPSPASARFSAVARTVTDLFVSTSFIHFWLPLPQSEYVLPADVEMWTQLQLGQSWMAKPVAPGKSYISMIQGRGELEVIRRQLVPGYAAAQKASRQDRDRVEEKLLKDGCGPCFCQSALRKMDEQAAAARSEVFADDQPQGSHVEDCQQNEDEQLLSLAQPTYSILTLQPRSHT